MARTVDSGVHTNGRHGGAKPKITLLHATSPGCWWSWGYEGTLNRIRLVYGDQVDVRLMTHDVYDDFNDYLKRYGIDFAQYRQNQRDAAKTMDVPVEFVKTRADVPKSTLPATLAALAAKRQGDAKARRFSRALTREIIAEGRDPGDKALFLEAAREANLDLKKFEKDLADRQGLLRDMEHQGHGHLPVGFYNVAVTDGQGRAVLLDYAFEPAAVEQAIDYLSGGKLKKSKPTDIQAYLRENGPAPPSEIARVFGLPRAKATTSLTALAKKGRAKEVRSPGGALCFAPA